MAATEEARCAQQALCRGAAGCDHGLRHSCDCSGACVLNSHRLCALLRAPAARRLSSLFGSELGGRLAKLCLDIDPLPEYQPDSPAQNAREKQDCPAEPARQSSGETAHPSGSADKAARTPGRSPAGAFQRASSLPSNSGEADAGQG